MVKVRVPVTALVQAAAMAAVLVVVQVVMSGLPNIEAVSLLVMMYTLHNPRLARAAIAVFVVLQGFIYGFHLWWFSYLYLWFLLHFAVYGVRRYMSPLFAAMVNGAFGLLFGSLCSLPYFISGGVSAGAAYIIAGIPFDLMHAAGNFLLALVLYKPLVRLFAQLPGGVPAHHE